MDVSVIVSWFIDVSTHDELGSVYQHHHSPSIVLHVGFLYQKKEVLLLMNNSKRCRMKSAFVHSSLINAIPVYPFQYGHDTCVIVYLYYERRLFCLHLNLHSLFRCCCTSRNSSSINLACIH